MSVPKRKLDIDSGQPDISPNNGKKTCLVQSVNPERPEHSRLVILDLNGFLMYREYNRQPRRVNSDGKTGEQGDAGPCDSEKKTEIVPGFMQLGNFRMWKRPYVDEFLDFLLNNFRVAVWTSVTQRNASVMVQYLFGIRTSELLFVWDQSKCTQVKHPETTRKPLFLKNLSTVWDVYGEIYDASNTLLIDDSRLKARENPTGTLFHVTPWVARDGGDDLGKTGTIRRWLNGLLEWTGDLRDYNGVEVTNIDIQT